MYKALRVPVSLLHQKIYDTSTRLDKRTPITQEKKKEPVVTLPDIAMDITYMAYIRKFFYRVNSKVLICRICGKEAHTMDERCSHYTQPCYEVGLRTLRVMVADRTCAVCEKELGADVSSEAGRDGIPACSDACLELWDIMSPDAYKQELAVSFELEKRDGNLYHG